MKTKLKNQTGFTIIEVLIVLAIAGLIMLIVFLAVPALQRNSRNTQRRNDVSALLGAMQEFTNNNNGSLPGASDSAAVASNAQRGIYQDDSLITVTEGSIPSAPGDESVQLETVQIVTEATCDSATTATTDGASPREYVILFWVETSSGTQPQCQAS